MAFLILTKFMLGRYFIYLNVGQTLVCPAQTEVYATKPHKEQKIKGVQILDTFFNWKFWNEQRIFNQSSCANSNRIAPR